MPFSGGNYTPPAPPVFPAVSGQVISSSYFNSVINDIATALSSTFLRDGSVPMGGNLDMNGNQVDNIDVGTVGAPGIAFEGFPTSGVYIDGSGNICISDGGVQAMKISDSWFFLAGQTPVTMAYAATITPALNTSLNYNLAMTGNALLADPSTMTPGSGGAIVITQDATGSRLMTFGAQWHFPAGVPSLSTAANSIDVLCYYVATSGIIIASLTKGYVHS